VKTISLKKVSAVAVASLGFGLLSVVPAYAAAGTATAVTISKTTEVAGVDLATGEFTSNPVRDANQISAFNVDAGAAVSLEYTAVGGTILNDDDELKLEMVGYGTLVASAVAAANVADGSEGVLGDFNAPLVPGTYTLRLTLAKAGTYAAATDLTTEVSMKVAALSAFSTGVSTVYINDSAAAAGTATTDAAGASGIKTAATIAANISVDLERANGDDYASGTFYAYVDGPGLIDIVADNTDFNGNLSDASTCTALCRSDSLASDGLFNIAVYGDGTTGVGTIKSYVILADGTTKVLLADKKVSFYGSAAKLEATLIQAIATPGVENGNCTALTDCTFATLAEKPAVTIKATDSSGVLVPDLTVTAEITDSTVISASTLGEATGATDYNGKGFYNASVTGGTAALVGKSTTVKYYVTVSGEKIYSNAVTFSLAGTPRTVTWALDKTSYAPGEKVLITVTAKDAAGNPAADGTYANLFAGATTASGSITGSTPAASVELVGGKKEYTAFAPGTGGNYTITNTTSTSTGASAGTVLTGTVVVTNPNAALLTQIDALNAKIVALNALIAKIMKKLGVK